MSFNLQAAHAFAYIDRPSRETPLINRIYEGRKKRKDRTRIALTPGVRDHDAVLFLFSPSVTTPTIRKLIVWSGAVWLYRIWNIARKIQRLARLTLVTHPPNCILTPVSHSTHARSLFVEWKAWDSNGNQYTNHDQSSTFSIVCPESIGPRNNATTSYNYVKYATGTRELYSMATKLAPPIIVHLVCSDSLL